MKLTLEATQNSVESKTVSSNRATSLALFPRWRRGKRFAVTQNRFDFLVNNLSSDWLDVRQGCVVPSPGRLMEINNPSTFSKSNACVLGKNRKKDPFSIWQRPITALMRTTLTGACIETNRSSLRYLLMSILKLGKRFSVQKPSLSPLSS